MGFLNKLKELFTDVEEIDEVDSEEETEEEKNELPKVMREAVLEEEKKHEREEIEIKQIPPVKREEVNLNQTREQRFDFSKAIEKAIENYEDFGVAYEIPKEEEKIEKENNDIKIVNHNDEEAKAEQIEMKEVVKVENTNASSANKDDLFDLIDSMYEDKED